MTNIKYESKKYYIKSLKEKTHTAYLVFDGDNFIGTGGVSYFSVMPTYHNSSGEKAYIMNMYVKPEYRRKGVATNTLKLLIEDAKSKGITSISLEATKMGKTLYEKCGFTLMLNEMELLDKETA